MQFENFRSTLWLVTIYINIYFLQRYFDREILNIYNHPGLYFEPFDIENFSAVYEKYNSNFYFYFISFIYFPIDFYIHNIFFFKFSECF